MRSLICFGTKFKLSVDLIHLLKAGTLLKRVLVHTVHTIRRKQTDTDNTVQKKLLVGG